MRKITLEEAINTLIVNGGFREKDLLKMKLKEFFDKVDSYIGIVESIELRREKEVK